MHETGTNTLSGAGALRRTLGTPGGLATVVELVPWAGALQDAKGAKPPTEETNA